MMDLHAGFEYNSAPGRLVFGSGTVQRLPEELTRRSLSSSLILTTPEQSSHATAIRDLLTSRGAIQANAIKIFTKATMQTPTHITAQGVEVATSSSPATDCIISIGGGSTIGLGKAISWRTGLHHVCLPTTYAGSEMTPILGETADGLKTTRTDPRILPGTVIYDVEFTMTLPPGLTATSGINAIAHSIEALYAPNANPVAYLLAIESIKSLATALPVITGAAKDPSSTQAQVTAARAEALYGAWLCGTALGSVGMSLHHKLCHTLGGTFNLPHAETHTIVLPHALAYNAPSIPAVMTRLARTFAEAEGDGKASDADDADDAIAALNRLLARLGVKRALGELGLKEEDIDKAADIAVQVQYSNPREVERNKIRELIRRAYAGEDARANL